MAADPEPAPRQGCRPAVSLGVLGAAVIVGLLFHVGLGSSDSGSYFTLHLAPGQVVGEILRGPVPGGEVENVIVWQIRLPRAIACLLVGGLLGAVGSAFQALFRNPLAEPYIVGVSSGAAVGGALAILMGFAAWASGLGLLMAAFVGGLCSLGIVFGLVGRRGAADVQTLLLAGVVVGAMLTAVLALVLLAAGEDTNVILRWMLGSATPMSWNRLSAVGPALLIGGAILLFETKRLNAFAVGEETARRLGVDTRRLKRTVLVTGTAMAAVAVGTVGIIGFLGLVAPHIARQVVGVDWRWSLIGASLTGMALLIPADVIAQWALPGGEVPVGVVTALLGAPFLLTLIRRSAGS